MRNWYRSLTVVLALTSIIGFGVAAAADDPQVPVISDGRVNAQDIAAPVAVYCEFDGYTTTAGDTVTLHSWLESIDLYAQRYTDGAWENVVSVTGEELEAAQDLNATTPILLESSASVSLTLNADGSLTATAPNTNGGEYTFTWKLGDVHC